MNNRHFRGRLAVFFAIAVDFTFRHVDTFSMRKAKISSKGQITIPQRFRERMNLTPSREVEMEQLEDGTVLVRPKKSVMRLAGSFKPNRPVLPFKEERRLAREAMVERHRRILEQP